MVIKTKSNLFLKLLICCLSLVLGSLLLSCIGKKSAQVPQQISLHFGTQGIKDFQFGSKDVQPAGAAFYDLKWGSELGTIKFEHGKLTSTFEHILSAMGVVWARKVQEGVVKLIIHAGISKPNLITHQEAQQRMMQLIKQLLADGWQQYFFPYQARIAKQDNWRHIQEIGDVIDPQQQLSLAKSLDQAAETAKSIKSQSPAQKSQLDNSLNQLKAAGIIQTAPNGIASTTSQSQLHAAGEHIQLISGQDTNITAGANATIHAADSLAIFAQSKGAKLQANQGKIEIQAQHDEMQINSLKDMHITSSHNKVVIAAKDEVLLACGGGYIKLKDGQIELGCPITVRVKAMGLPIEGPTSLDYGFNSFVPGNDEMFVVKNKKTGRVMANQRYKIVRSDGEVFKGITNKKGETVRVNTGEGAMSLKLHLTND